MVTLAIDRSVKSLFLSILFLSVPALASDRPFTMQYPDQQLHFGVAAIATVTGSVVGKEIGISGAPVVSALVVLFAGAIKEYAIDQERSLSDLKANTAGALAGLTFSFVF